MDNIANARIANPHTEYNIQDTIRLSVRFTVQGDIRDTFNETNWTESYEANDVSVKIKYGIRLIAGRLRKKNVGDVIDSYRKAAIFWTRNPKLVNPMKDKRVWVQVAKNFTPIIRLTEEEVRQELFDYDEEYPIKASELGEGTHSIRGEIYVSWQKHHMMEKNTIKAEIPPATITIKI